MNLKSNQKGFTIVELLIVIVVIAILAAISIVAFTGIQQRGRDSQRASDVSNIVKALTAYTTDGGQWPANAAGVAAPGPTNPGVLRGYTTANLSDDILDKLTVDGTAATPEAYAYEPCGTSPNFTGAKIRYYSEQNGGVSDDTTVVAGVC